MSEEVVRKAISPRNKGYSQNATVGGEAIILTTSEYDDGRLGGIQIRMPKTDSNISGLLACFSNSVSIGLQFGVPLQEFVKRKFYLRFKSSGEVVGNTAIVNATSISDYEFRELAITYLGRVDLAQTDIEESRDSRRNVILQQNR
jgi:ribonucleoside-diphosphate reductase alpha chain